MHAKLKEIISEFLHDLWRIMKPAVFQIDNGKEFANLTRTILSKAVDFRAVIRPERQTKRVRVFRC
jgi:hypothetical protein